METGADQYGLQNKYPLGKTQYVQKVQWNPNRLGYECAFLTVSWHISII